MLFCDVFSKCRQKTSFDPSALSTESPRVDKRVDHEPKITVPTATQQLQQNADAVQELQQGSATTGAAVFIADVVCLSAAPLQQDVQAELTGNLQDDNLEEDQESFSTPDDVVEETPRDPIGRRRESSASDMSCSVPSSDGTCSRSSQSSFTSSMDGHLTHELLCKYLETLEQLEQQLGENTRLVFKRNQLIKVLEGASMEYAQNLAEVYYFKRFIAERDQNNVVVKKEEAERRAKQAMKAAKSFKEHIGELARDLANLKYDIAMSFRNIDLKRAAVRKWWRAIPRDVLSVEQHERYLKHLTDSFQNDFVSRAYMANSRQSQDLSSKRASSETLGSSSTGSLSSGTPATIQTSQVPSASQPSPRIRRSSISLGTVLGLEEDQKKTFSVETTEHVASRVEMETGQFEIPLLRKLREVAGVSLQDLPTLVLMDTDTEQQTQKQTDEIAAESVKGNACVVPRDDTANDSSFSDLTSSVPPRVFVASISLPPLSPRPLSARPAPPMPSVPVDPTQIRVSNCSEASSSLRPFYSPTILRSVVSFDTVATTTMTPSVFVPRLKLDNLHQTAPDASTSCVSESD